MEANPDSVMNFSDLVLKYIGWRLGPANTTLIAANSGFARNTALPPP